MVTPPPGPMGPPVPPPPVAPRKSRTGLILGLVLGGMALLLVVCGGAGFLIWQNFFDDSPEGAQITGEYRVIETLCGAFDHKDFADYSGGEPEIAKEEYKPAYDQESADSDPETADCSLSDGDDGGQGRQPLTAIVYWFVEEGAAVADFEDLKVTLADSSDSEDPQELELDEVDAAYYAVTNLDGKPLYVTVAAVDANISITVTVDVFNEDAEGAQDVATGAVTAVMRSSRH